MNTLRTTLIGIGLQLSLIVILPATSTVSRTIPHGKEDWAVPEEAKKRKNPITVTDAGLSSARDIYREKCLRCHGENGKGDGAEAGMYRTKAADFSDSHMMTEMTDGEIFYKMTEGRRPMPSFKKSLSEEQRWQLVHFLRTFAPRSAVPTDKSNKLD